MRQEERVAILVPDSSLGYRLLGAIKMKAVAVPMNTTLLAKDYYQYLLGDSRARVVVLHVSLLEHIKEIRPTLPHLEYVILVGGEAEGCLTLEQLLPQASPCLDAADTSKDDMAFWLYSRGPPGFHAAPCSTT